MSKHNQLNMPKRTPQPPPSPAVAAERALQDWKLATSEIRQITDDFRRIAATWTPDKATQHHTYQVLRSLMSTIENPERYRLIDEGDEEATP